MKQVTQDLRRGIANVFRWIPVIWDDNDFDWEYLARIMRYKMSRMATAFETDGMAANSGRHAKQLRVSAELLRRLIDDEYWINASKWLNETKRVATHANAMAKQDETYLGRMIGKHLRCWWD